MGPAGPGGGGGGGGGRFSHYIVWNEAASATWFDLTPDIQRDAPPSPRAAAAWAGRYAALLASAHAAVARAGGGPAVVWASIDQAKEGKGGRGRGKG